MKATYLSDSSLFLDPEMLVVNPACVVSTEQGIYGRSRPQDGHWSSALALLTVEYNFLEVV